MAAVLMIHVPLYVPALFQEGMKDGITPLKRRELFATPPSEREPVDG
jgi:hypothetical protein